MHREVLWKIENFLKYFHTLYNPGFWGNDWSCEDKLWAKKVGLYTLTSGVLLKFSFRSLLALVPALRAGHITVWEPTACTFKLHVIYLLKLWRLSCIVGTIGHSTWHLTYWTTKKYSLYSRYSIALVATFPSRHSESLFLDLRIAKYFPPIHLLIVYGGAQIFKGGSQLKPPKFATVSLYGTGVRYVMHY